MLENIKEVWKLFWDITAVVVGLYFGYKTFLYVGERIPAFGYFPIGIIAGLLVLGIGAIIIHGIEVIIEAIIVWISCKLFGLKFENVWPFK